MKKMLAVMAAGISLCQMPIALASPVNITGDVSVKYERDTNDQEPTTSGMVYTTKIMGEIDFGAGWSGYARLGAQHITRSGFGDFNTDGSYDPDKKSVIALDQFGLLYKTDNLTYKFGRQDVGVGKTALLYSRADSNIGKKAFVDGVTLSGTVGIMDISAIVAQEDNVGSADNKIYAIRTGYNPQENLNLGLTIGHYQDSSAENTNHWAVDGTYKFGKNSLTAEFTQSSSNTNNKAYAATWNYALDDKTTTAVTAFRVESNSDMGKQSDFDNDNQGFHYGITHNLTEADNIEVVYKVQKTISDKNNNNKLEATFSHSF